MLIVAHWELVKRKMQREILLILLTLEKLQTGAVRGSESSKFLFFSTEKTLVLTLNMNPITVHFSDREYCYVYSMKSLPTKQLDRWQFSLRLWCVIVVAANVASSCQPQTGYGGLVRSLLSNYNPQLFLFSVLYSLNPTNTDHLIRLC